VLTVIGRVVALFDAIGHEADETMSAARLAGHG
jgi:hypothetical protein